MAPASLHPRHDQPAEPAARVTRPEVEVGGSTVTASVVLYDPDLDIDETSVIVLRNAGPQGAPGMPEWGQLPIPKKLLARGVRPFEVPISYRARSREEGKKITWRDGVYAIYAIFRYNFGR